MATAMTSDDVLAVLASRISADTGQDQADVRQRLDELNRTPRDEVNPVVIVDLLAPTATALGIPVASVLDRLDGVPEEQRGPVLTQLAGALAPAVVQAVRAEGER
ncbi:hypothetical protein [Streptosporangium sp. NPDC051022]|uniref:hypothetical protein n=1 Tax=Streptosporangium sp. NPDC051022 TaxID=3155752 RepID=UPI003429FE5A